MHLQSNASWLFSIIATVTLFTGGSVLLDNQHAGEAEMIQFTDLSDADIQQILAVKAEMNSEKESFDVSSI